MFILHFYFLCYIKVYEWYTRHPKFRQEISVFNHLMDCYARMKLAHKAQEVFDNLGSFSCLPSASTFNVLISAWSRVNKLDKAEQVYGLMLQKRYIPSE